MLLARSVAEHGRRSFVIAVLAGAVLTALVVADRGSAARPQCADAVLEDWTAGTLGDEYASDCYEAAIDALPEDLRAYTTAADDILRAQIAASRVSAAAAAPGLDGSARRLAGEAPSDDELRAVPAEVVFLGGLLAALAAAGIVAALVRRRRGR